MNCKCFLWTLYNHKVPRLTFMNGCQFMKYIKSFFRYNLVLHIRCLFEIFLTYCNLLLCSNRCSTETIGPRDQQLPNWSPSEHKLHFWHVQQWQSNYVNQTSDRRRLVWPTTRVWLLLAKSVHPIQFRWMLANWKLSHTARSSYISPDH